MEFPTTSDVAIKIKAIKDDMLASQNYKSDVRLQVHGNGDWELHTGDASYDTNHLGYWGSTTIDLDSDDNETPGAIADDLICQCEDHYAQIIEDDDGFGSRSMTGLRGDREDFHSDG